MTATNSSFSIVRDHPERHLVRRTRQRISTLTGGVLLTVGLAAAIPAIPANLAVVAFVISWAETSASDADPWPPDDVPMREIGIVWAVVTPLSIAGIAVGLRLLRRKRMLVLFLRRFGHDQAQYAVTSAVLQTIGASWRVVTLDDAELSPIGPPAGVRWLFAGGRFAFRHAATATYVIGLRLFPMLILAMWGVIAVAVAEPALDYVRTGRVSWSAWEAALEPYFEILTLVFEWRLPLDAVQPTMPGLFALLATTAMVSFATLGVMMAAILIALPLAPVLVFLSSSADAVLEAERSKAVTVTTADELLEAARAIERRSRQVFGPRLVVVRTPSTIWQRAVTALSSKASVQLIDISEPTENVLWELEELTIRFRDRSVIIGDYEQVTRLATPCTPGAGAGQLTGVERRLAALLHGREVLAYTTDRRGLRRFACALRGKLLTLSAAPRGSSPR